MDKLTKEQIHLLNEHSEQMEITNGKAYLARVRQLPCCICERFGMHQTTLTTAHHPICFRYSMKKVPDSMAIPLCDCHHQGLWGGSKGKLAIHKSKRQWEKAYGLDTDYIEHTRMKVKEMKEENDVTDD